MVSLDELLMAVAIKIKYRYYCVNTLIGFDVSIGNFTEGNGSVWSTFLTELVALNTT